MPRGHRRITSSLRAVNFYVALFVIFIRLVSIQIVIKMSSHWKGSQDQRNHGSNRYNPYGGGGGYHSGSNYHGFQRLKKKFLKKIFG